MFARFKPNIPFPGRQWYNKALSYACFHPYKQRDQRVSHFGITTFVTPG